MLRSVAAKAWAEVRSGGAPRWIAAVAMPIVLAMMVAACSDSRVPTDAEGDKLAYDAFRTAVASLPNRQFQVYWLGRQFTAGGVLYKGPYLAGMGAVSDEGQFYIEYLGVGALRIGLYDDTAWQAYKARAPVPAGVMPKDTQVQGVLGQLYVIPVGTRPIDEWQLEFRLGETWVLAVADAGGGSGLSPLADEETFLSVMQQLRPYPQ